MPKQAMKFSEEIVNQMHLVRNQIGWSFLEISRWLLEVHQIHYSPVSVHRYFAKQDTQNTKTKQREEMDIEKLDSKTLLRNIQLHAYKQAMAASQKENNRHFRSHAQVFLTATALLFKQGWNEENEEFDFQEDQLPTFVVADPLEKETLRRYQ